MATRSLLSSFWCGGWHCASTASGLCHLGEAELGEVGQAYCPIAKQPPISGGWMSSDPRLVAEIESLRSSLEALRLRVRALEEEREEARGESFSVSGQSSYSFVTSTITAPPVETSRLQTSTVSSHSEVASTDIAGRSELARQVGLYLRRCLGPGPRGSSGRDRLRLQNRCYVIVADFNGRQLPEVAFVTAFSEVRRICKRGADCGQSIFVGLPTKWEARVALEAGGFALPADLHDD